MSFEKDHAVAKEQLGKAMFHLNEARKVLGNDCPAYGLIEHVIKLTDSARDSANHEQ